MALTLAFLVSCDVSDCTETFAHPVEYSTRHNEANRAAVAAGWGHSGHNGAYTCPAHKGESVRLNR